MVYRSYDDIFAGDYAVLRAWKNDAYVARSERGELLGYMSVSQDGEKISEIDAKDLDSLKSMLFCWQKKLRRDISFTFSPHKVETVKYYSEVCAEMSLNSPCHFKIINFDKLLDALLKVKAAYIPNLSEGESAITIKDWGDFLLYHKNGIAFCEKMDKEGTIALDRV